MKLINLCIKAYRKLLVCLSKVYTPINYIILKSNECQVGKKFRARGLIHVRNDGNLVFGDNVRINSAWWANPIGVGSRAIFEVRNGGIITIGNNCGISNSAFIARERIVIEDNVLIGSGCRIYDNDFHLLQVEDRIQQKNQNIITKPVAIQEGAFIGADVTILKGVTIGRYAIIGAGAVVTKSVPEGEVWGGNPAKKIS